MCYVIHLNFDTKNTHFEIPFIILFINLSRVLFTAIIGGKGRIS